VTAGARGAPKGPRSGRRRPYRSSPRSGFRARFLCTGALFRESCFHGGDRRFESASLQRRVSLSRDALISIGRQLPSEPGAPRTPPGGRWLCTRKAWLHEIDKSCT
jgi:hypothetical protein